MSNTCASTIPAVRDKGWDCDGTNLVVLRTTSSGVPFVGRTDRLDTWASFHQASFKLDENYFESYDNSGDHLHTMVEVSDDDA